MGRWRTRARSLFGLATLAIVMSARRPAVAYTDAEVVAEGGGFPWGTTFLIAMALVLAVGFGYLTVRGPRRPKMTWQAAWGWGFVVFAYFLLATAWFPSWVLSQQSVASAERWVADLVGTAAWIVPFLIGLVALRWLQKTERI
jgi:hypothetical protein